MFSASSGRVRVQPHPYLVGRGRDFRLGCAAGQQFAAIRATRTRQHVSLREHQAVERVVGGLFQSISSSMT